MAMKASQKKWLIIALLLLLLAGVKVLVLKGYLEQHLQPVAQRLRCQRLTGPCLLPDGGQLSFNRVPQHGRPFELRVHGIRSSQPPTVAFTMPAMEMGFNRYTFVRQQDDWVASIILPLCSSGGHEWLANLVIDGNHYQLPFTTQ
ncbi:hypothetical protein HZU77_006060 [Neisseriaceae bacterium TC5R-5]|nr:hypothetical protein [Neisseriaceae bacterium TC5R-5]